MATKKSTSRTKTTQKSAHAKKTSTRMTSTKSAPKQVRTTVSPDTKTTTTTKRRTLNVKRIPRPAALVIGILVIIGILYLLRSLFVVAVVNGQPIDRFTFTGQLQQQYGKQVLSTMVTQTLIEQEARKKNINVSQSDINAQLKQVENSVKAQGQDLDQLLAAQGMTRAQLIDQLKTEVMIEKLLANQTKVTDKEINDYIAKNKSSLPNESGAQLKADVKQQLIQSKLQQAYQPWITNLQKNAKVTYLVNF